MFELAVRAGLPIIGVHTDDPANFVRVVQELTGKMPYMIATNKSSMLSAATPSLFWTPESDIVTTALYGDLTKSGKQLIIMNPERKALIFDAGELPTPQKLVMGLLEDQVLPEQMASVVDALKGLSLKSVGEITSLTQARTGGMSVPELRRTRLEVMGGVQGLSPVDTNYEFYVWPKDLKKWVEQNKKYFLGHYDHRLVPRGLLFYGPPGCGKSMASKAIANEFGVPLYRLDVNLTLGKFVGESEKQIARVLKVVEREEPCVLLIDETEKIFAEREDGGVTSRILGQLLWWLSEHRSKVFTVMTTNNIKVIPPELYRAGRIDSIYSINMLSKDDAFEFACIVFESVMGKPPEGDEGALRQAMGATAEFNHAAVAEMVYQFIKSNDLLDK